MTDPDSSRRTVRIVLVKTRYPFARGLAEHIRTVHALYFFPPSYYSKSYYGTIPTSAGLNAQNRFQGNVWRVFFPSTFSLANLRMGSPGRACANQRETPPARAANLLDELTRYLTANPSVRSFHRKVVGQTGTARRSNISRPCFANDAERQSAERSDAAGEAESGSDDS